MVRNISAMNIAKTIISKLRIVKCRYLHKGIYRPVSGFYTCKVCLLKHRSSYE